MRGTFGFFGAIALGFLLAGPGQARADGELDVGGLKTMCAQTGSADGCRYFIYGVIEGATFGDGFKVPGGQLCVAPSASIADLEAAVKAALADLKTIDDEIDIPAAAFVATVSTHQFPCPR